MQAIKDPIRAEWLVLALRLYGLSDQDILEWWESADVEGHGSPRSLWRANRFEEVERAVGAAPIRAPRSVAAAAGVIGTG